MQLLGHGKFHRLRIGIGHPGHKDRVTRWVLGRPGKDDEALIARAIDDAIDVLPLAVAGDFNEAMKRLHTQRNSESAHGDRKAWPVAIRHSRFSIPDSNMGIKCGIVGLPNVGKSTLFNALTKAGIAAANFPFCTIEPNVGVVPVPDPRLNAAVRDRQAAEGHPDRGRVRRHRRPGRRCRQGRRAWATSSWPTSAKSMRSPTWCAASSTTTSSTSPTRSIRLSDIDTIDTELALADLDSRRKGAEPRRAFGQGRRQGRDRAQAGAGRSCAPRSTTASPAAASVSTTTRQALVRDLFLLTLKPVLYIANVHRGRLREQSAPGRGARARRGRRRRGGAGVGRDRGRTVAAGRRRPRRPSWPTWAWTSRA